MVKREEEEGKFLRVFLGFNEEFVGELGFVKKMRKWRKGFEFGFIVFLKFSEDGQERD